MNKLNKHKEIQISIAYGTFTSKVGRQHILKGMSVSVSRRGFLKRKGAEEDQFGIATTDLDAHSEVRCDVGKDYVLIYDTGKMLDSVTAKFLPREYLSGKAIPNR